MKLFLETSFASIGVQKVICADDKLLVIAKFTIPFSRVSLASFSKPLFIRNLLPVTGVKGTQIAI